MGRRSVPCSASRVIPLPIQAPDVRYALALSLVPGVGPGTYRKLLHSFGTPDRALGAPAALLETMVPRNVARAIVDGADEAALDLHMQWAREADNHLLTWADDHYPRLLLEVADPPPVLFVKGRTELLSAPAIAIVGSRNPSAQGMRDAETFATALGEAGWCILSGLALGIDTAAHLGGLKARSRSVAVVGTGLDTVYPARNRTLAHRLAEEGALVSEFPLQTAPVASNFPRRNRLISGLSRGLLVVEAALKSGSLITAKFAAEQGKEVFAIPGSIHSPLSKGCHALIKQGAKLVESAQDIVEELGGANPIPQREQVRRQSDSPVLRALGEGLVHLDTLVARTGLTPEKVCAMLLTLELEGEVACLPGGFYQRLH